MTNVPTVPGQLPAPATDDVDRLLIKEVALDIGKAAVHHLEMMYPAAFAAVARTAKLSLRNFIFNEIMGALAVIDADAIRTRLAQRKSHRRTIRAMRAAGTGAAAHASADPRIDEAMDRVRDVLVRSGLTYDGQLAVLARLADGLDADEDEGT